jgi:hypothetical protein
MKLSAFFGDLSSSYGYEIEDLTYDSAGDNVLKSRLKVKRDQFAALLPMAAFDPVMVAPVFRDAFTFRSREVFDRLVAGTPDDFPNWEAVEAELDIAPWAGKLVQSALATPGCEQFMLIAVGLEYIQSGPGAAASAARDEADESAKGSSEEGDDDDQDADLAEAGEDYLSEQGFDRRS